MTTRRAQAIVDGMVRLAFAAAALAATGGVLLNAAVSTEGPGDCEQAARAQVPEFFDSAGVSRTMFTRYRHQHLVAALVVQSFDLDEPPITVVCTFAGTNYARPVGVEVFKDDRVDALKGVSTPLEVPRTWFR